MVKRACRLSRLVTSNLVSAHNSVLGVNPHFLPVQQNQRRVKCDLLKRILAQSELTAYIGRPTIGRRLRFQDNICLYRLRLLSLLSIPYFQHITYSHIPKLPFISTSIANRIGYFLYGFSFSHIGLDTLLTTFLSKYHTYISKSWLRHTRSVLIRY